MVEGTSFPDTEALRSLILLRSNPSDRNQILDLQALALHFLTLESVEQILKQCPALHTLDLRRNKLSNLPLEFGAIFSLKEVYLNSNNFEKIPFCLFSLKSLELLSLTKNRIRFIPDEIANLKNTLKTFYISDNRLVDPLNPRIFECKKIEVLHLQNNKFSYMPKGIAELKNLREIGIEWLRYLSRESSIGSQKVIRTDEEGSSSTKDDRGKYIDLLREVCRENFNLKTILQNLGVRNPQQVIANASLDFKSLELHGNNCSSTFIGSSALSNALEVDFNEDLRGYSPRMLGGSGIIRRSGANYSTNPWFGGVITVDDISIDDPSFLIGTTLSDLSPVINHLVYTIVSDGGFENLNCSDLGSNLGFSEGNDADYGVLRLKNQDVDVEVGRKSTSIRAGNVPGIIPNIGANKNNQQQQQQSADGHESGVSSTTGGGTSITGLTGTSASGVPINSNATSSTKKGTATGSLDGSTVESTSTVGEKAEKPKKRSLFDRVFRRKSAKTEKGNQKNGNGSKSGESLAPIQTPLSDGTTNLTNGTTNLTKSNALTNSSNTLTVPDRDGSLPVRSDMNGGSPSILSSGIALTPITPGVTPLAITPLDGRDNSITSIPSESPVVVGAIVANGTTRQRGLQGGLNASFIGNSEGISTVNGISGLQTKSPADDDDKTPIDLARYLNIIPLSAITKANSLGTPSTTLNWHYNAVVSKQCPLDRLGANERTGLVISPTTDDLADYYRPIYETHVSVGQILTRITTVINVAGKELNIGGGIAKEDHALTVTKKAAVKAGVTELIRESLPEPFEVNSTFDEQGRTRLHIAIIENDVGVARGLIDSPGIDVNRLDNDNFSALLYAVRDDRKEISRYLFYKANRILWMMETDLQKELEMNRKKCEAEIQGIYDLVVSGSGLSRSQQENSLRIRMQERENALRKLITVKRHVLSLDKLNDNSTTNLNTVASLSNSTTPPSSVFLSPDVGGANFGSPLHVSVVNFEPELVYLLLKSKADPDRRDADGNSPLHVLMSVFSRGSNLGKNQIIALLLLKYNSHCNIRNNDGWGPIHLATRRNETAALNFMVKHQKTRLDQNGDQPRLDREKLCETLVRIKSKLQNIMSVEGREIDNTQKKVHLFSSTSSTELLTLRSVITEDLLKWEVLSDCNNSVTTSQRNLLDHLDSFTTPQRRKEDLDDLRMMNDGFNLNLRGGPHSWTPLHLAGHTANITCLFMLLEAKANVLLSNADGRTCRHAARGNFASFKIIKKAEEQYLYEKVRDWNNDCNIHWNRNYDQDRIISPIINPDDPDSTKSILSPKELLDSVGIFVEYFLPKNMRIGNANSPTYSPSSGSYARFPGGSPGLMSVGSETLPLGIPYKGTTIDTMDARILPQGSSTIDGVNVSTNSPLSEFDLGSPKFRRSLMTKPKSSSIPENPDANKSKLKIRNKLPDHITGNLSGNTMIEPPIGTIAGIGSIGTSTSTTNPSSSMLRARRFFVGKSGDLIANARDIIRNSSSGTDSEFKRSLESTQTIITDPFRHQVQPWHRKYLKSRSYSGGVLYATDILQNSTTSESSSSSTSGGSSSSSTRVILNNIKFEKKRAGYLPESLMQAILFCGGGARNASSNALFGLPGVRTIRGSSLSMKSSSIKDSMNTNNKTSIRYFSSQHGNTLARMWFPSYLVTKHEEDVFGDPNNKNGSECNIQCSRNPSGSRYSKTDKRNFRLMFFHQPREELETFFVSLKTLPSPMCSLSENGIFNLLHCLCSSPHQLMQHGKICQSLWQEYVKELQDGGQKGEDQKSSSNSQVVGSTTKGSKTGGSNVGSEPGSSQAVSSTRNNVVLVASTSRSSSSSSSSTKIRDTIRESGYPGSYFVGACDLILSMPHAMRIPFLIDSLRKVAASSTSSRQKIFDLLHTPDSHTGMNFFSIACSYFSMKGSSRIDGYLLQQIFDLIYTTDIEKRKLNDVRQKDGNYNGNYGVFHLLLGNGLGDGHESSGSLSTSVEAADALINIPSPADKEGELYAIFEHILCTAARDCFDLNMASKPEGMTVLHLVCRGNNQRIEHMSNTVTSSLIRLFLDHSADPSKQERTTGWSPLHFAVSRRNYAAITALCYHEKINVNLQDKLEWPPLFEAVSNADERAVLLLLAARADPNFRTEDSDAVSIIYNAKKATSEEKRLLLSVLVSNGFDITKRSVNSQSSVAIAERDLTRLQIDRRHYEQHQIQPHNQGLIPGKGAAHRHIPLHLKSLYISVLENRYNTELRFNRKHSLGVSIGSSSNIAGIMGGAATLEGAVVGRGEAQALSATIGTDENLDQVISLAEIGLETNLNSEDDLLDNAIPETNIHASRCSMALVNYEYPVSPTSLGVSYTKSRKSNSVVSSQTTYKSMMNKLRRGVVSGIRNPMYLTQVSKNSPHTIKVKLEDYRNHRSNTKNNANPISNKLSRTNSNRSQYVTQQCFVIHSTLSSGELCNTCRSCGLLLSDEDTITRKSSGLTFLDEIADDNIINSNRESNRVVEINNRYGNNYKYTGSTGITSSTVLRATSTTVVDTTVVGSSIVAEPGGGFFGRIFGGASLAARGTVANPKMIHSSDVVVNLCRICDAFLQRYLEDFV